MAGRGSSNDQIGQPHRLPVGYLAKPREMTGRLDIHGKNPVAKIGEDCRDEFRDLVSPLDFSFAP